MKNLQDLFEHELKDMYSAEKQLIEALPKMIETASNEKLVEAFSDHLKESKDHLNTIESICKDLGIEPGDMKCKAMAGLVKECEGMIKEDASPAVKDAGLIACAQRVEHYEIAGYGTACQFAKTLGHKEIAKKLDDILDQERNADDRLNDLAVHGINEAAKENK